MGKRIVIGLVLLGIAGGCAYYWNGRTAASQDQEEYTAAKVERGNLRKLVSPSGSVVSNLDVEIKCKASGQITSLLFDVGDSVTQNDLLLEIDPIDEERSVRQAEVQLASAEARLAKARQTLAISKLELENSRLEAGATLTAAKANTKDLRDKAQRMAALQEKEFASPEEVGSAESAAVQAESSLQKASVGIRALKVSEERLALEEQDIKLAEAEIETSKISLETAKQRLKETKVYAPMAGIISDRLVQVGQIISSPTMNVSGGNALLVLSDLSRVFVLARVEESDIGSLQLGQAATITVDAFPDESFDGKVVRMAPMGEKLSNIVTFEVKIEVLDEAKSKLLPEMTADVEILVASRDDVLCVPSEVVQRRGAERFVMTPGAPGAPPNTVTIQTGVDDGTKTEILAGLNEGDTVLVAEFESSDDESGGRPGGPGGGMPGPPPF